MKPYFLQIVIVIATISCANKNNQDGQTQHDSKHIHDDTFNYTWTKVLDSAEWKKSYNFEMFAIRDTLWVFHPDGRWFSADGLHWTKSSLANPIYNFAFLDYVQVNDTIYGLGHFEGNIEHFTFKPEIYRTTDLKKWDTISHNSNLPARFFYHPFTFQNKIWIIGGEDKNTQYGDIWNSSDGIHWEKQADNLPFGKQSGAYVILFNGKLFLLGNNIWSSTDGLNWQLETKEIVKGEEHFGGTPVIFDNKIWLLACNRNGQFLSKVFVSNDGKNWHGEDAPWSPRGAVAAAVFKNKIYMTGGKYGGFAEGGTTTEFIYSNDLWTLEKKNNAR